jgi:hypothetical protein
MLKRIFSHATPRVSTASSDGAAGRTSPDVRGRNQSPLASDPLLALPSDVLPMVRAVARRPSRIDLLELDIDLRLADLWREANEIADWNFEVVGAFIRAAYGKGYCDALTEDSRGALCVEHGYRVPERRDRTPVEDR